MGNSYEELKEYLLVIRRQNSEKMEELYKSGGLMDYLLNLHRSMINKYPEMIDKVYTDEHETGGM